ncbi:MULTISPECIES: glutamine--fructose-6-phosphate transaminase (isomerizing) [unclassified Halomonas]|uniref:glutamine--fructose-6-phosphate transaminase (isomerizing) n=1 Tax=unclassified Halomonas TaxID=2609666 RepID=UPI001EF721EF|nr:MULTISPECIES: glutamine--fructose-6-phosphate transaminase (isomerizing) [unclassified Halomonas]MCG7577217.1 glutamine--fructose-6-phosphate transaminase (isomerizing) [Halomonas sp. MMH1-48]MCG7604282.1 glutamine--fructose-6-phosphate transaminase (isomerizing) [Halomonas sp. MM17-34]MCG7613531.1 glutamine--fructose-6-phosphate transaminase (isomerizing) [Halomonas sp. MM17-29]MCG7620305.1 glutamine--fructose-6-phosphate transaminase (isomerizing) [Halomonas sp. DSH1-27]
MCGIVGAISAKESTDFLLAGLSTLEYRGYDSAGLAVLNNGLQRARAKGRVAELASKVAEAGINGHVGIAHTRWATHGVPAERNAHPHISSGLAVVHNGIIENYESLREQLQGLGYVFTSDTDTETIAHLIQACFKGQIGEPAENLFSAVQCAVAHLKGAFALAVISEEEPDCLVVAREGSPLMLGVAEDGYYAASDASALLSVTKRMMYLENGDVARLSRDAVVVVDGIGQMVERAIVTSSLNANAVELGDYSHYMQKEIFEQPQALSNTLEMISGAGQLQPGIFGAEAAEIFQQVNSVLILACGTSSYAGMTAKYWIEQVAGIPCNVEIASEYRYRHSVPNPKQLVVVISQSGETADTLAALHHAKAQGHIFTLAICNVPESAIVRETALRFITRAGPEIGVASTKAFTTQLSALFLLTLLLAKANQHLSDDAEKAYLDELRHLPIAVDKVLALEPSIEAWSQHFANKHHALFLGRGRHYPIALEGALKLKEISYIHAEAYPAGELKHGPLALVDSDMPVVVVAPNDEMLEKLKANMQEVSARGGQLYVFADGGSEVTSSEGVNVLLMPEHYGLLSPVLHVVALQLLSYHVALVKGTDVDKPRNLAKSVTVE